METNLARATSPGVPLRTPVRLMVRPMCADPLCGWPVHDGDLVPGFRFRLVRAIRASLPAGEPELPALDSDLRVLTGPDEDGWFRDSRGVMWILGEVVRPAGAPLCRRHPVLWNEDAKALCRFRGAREDGDGSRPGGEAVVGDGDDRHGW